MFYTRDMNEQRPPGQRAPLSMQKNITGLAKRLVSAGILIILAGIIANLRVYFAPTSLYNTLIILGMIAAGVGLVARSVREHENSQPGPG